MINHQANNGASVEIEVAEKSSARIVLTAPVTEVFHHAGYFSQMRMASLPIWLEDILNNKYPRWRNLEI